MSIIGILVALILLGVMFWAARTLIAAFRIPDPLASVIIVIVVILMLFAVLNWIGVPAGLRLR